MANKIDWWKLGWEVSKGIGVAVAAVYSFWANQQSASNADALERLKLAAATRAQESELALKVYDLVEKTLTLEGPAARSHGLAAAALINALTGPPLQGGLLGALRAGSNDPELDRELDETLRFDAAADSRLPDASEPAAVETKPNQSSYVDRGVDALGRWLVAPVFAQGLPAALKGYRIDIFFCEARSAPLTDARRKRAQAAANRLQPAGANVTVAVRSLPMLVQARPAYRSVDDEVRSNNQRNEREAAAQLAAVLGIKTQRVRLTPETPNYLSVFYCN